MKNYKEVLNEIVEYLYDKKGNIAYCDNLTKDLNIEGEILEYIIDTKSVNKNILKGLNLSNIGYLRVELTSLGVKYFENGFKFDKDIDNSEIKNITYNFSHSNVNNSIMGDSGNISNYLNDVEKIVEIVKNSQFIKNDEILKIIKDIENNNLNSKDLKEKMKGMLSIIADGIAVGQFIPLVYNFVSTVLK